MWCRFIGLGEKDDSNLPFRKTQSMRATSSRRVQIVDHLKNQRRLSNSGDPFAGIAPILLTSCSF